MRTPIKNVLKAVIAKGWKAKIHYAHRTIAEQRVILAKGNSTIPFSFHNAYKDGKAAALAVDIIDKRKGYAWQIPTSHQYWQDLGAACKAEGLEWGGDWTSFKDVAHCQTPNMTVAQARAQSKPDISEEDWKWIQSKL